MKFLLSLDYEVFFGTQTGSIENCLVNPVQSLLKTLAPYGAKLSLFVDAGFIAKLAEERKHSHHLSTQLDSISRQLAELVEQGHDVQLHIHPHWEDSCYDGLQWQINTRRYRLHDFSQEEMAEVAIRYRDVLAKIVGPTIFAFRAGGWCLQPFSAISAALQDAGIWLDSTVFANGVSEDTERWYDFRNAPVKSHWEFSSNPLTESGNGPFVEVPISSFDVMPSFFFKMVLAKIVKTSSNKSFGDGCSMTYNKKYYIRRLTSKSVSPASIDGLKAGLLQNAFQQHKQRKRGDIFNVMGHPKALSRNSLKHLEKFLKINKNLEFITFQDLRYLKP